MSNEARETVDRILERARVSFSTTYRGERRNPLGFEPTSAGSAGNVMDEKALTIYLACQENADKLARIIDHTTREQLREALQDY